MTCMECIELGTACGAHEKGKTMQDLKKLAFTNEGDITQYELEEAVDDLFTYHPWDETKQRKGEAVAAALKIAYKAIWRNAPAGPARSKALGMLTEVRMLANAAITFEGRV